MSKILEKIFLTIPVFLILISAIASLYVYSKQLYPLTILTPITLFIIVILWFVGLLLNESNSKREIELKGGIKNNEKNNVNDIGSIDV